MTRLVTIWAALNFVAFAAGCAPEGSTREIPYDPRLPIAAQLLPTDKQVVITRDPSDAHVPLATGRSYEAELDRLRVGDMVALVRVTSVRGELVRQGSWIETRVAAQIEKLLRSNFSQSAPGPIEFAFSGGETSIGAISVTAGPFPRFQEGDQYLVVLTKHPNVLLSSALHVNAAGILEPLESSNGTAQFSQTPLVGKRATDVVRDLIAE